MNEKNMALLKNQPLFNGYTKYGVQNGSSLQCPAGAGTAKGAPATLESILAKMDPYSFNMNKYKVNQFGINKNRKSKKLDKKNKNKNKKKHKKPRHNKSFGSVAFQTGVLPQVGYPPSAALGLPYGVKPVNNIYQTFPNPMTKGAPLPRPYGPRDQIRMAMLTNVSGYGKEKKNTKKMKKSNSKSNSKKLRSFGNKLPRSVVTPGTMQWQNTLAKQTFPLMEYAKPELKMAKGLYTNEIQLAIPVKNVAPNYGVNVPMQYTNNQMNIPLFARKFSKKTKNKKDKKDKKDKKRSNKLKKRSNKLKKRSFGAMLPTSGMTGPNTVGHRAPMTVYHGGGTTTNLLTGKLYVKPGIVGGPTRGAGAIEKVQNDGITPNAWLATTPGLKAVTSGTNSARGFLHNGLGFGKKSKKSKKSKKDKKRLSRKRSRKYKKLKNCFSSEIYTPEGIYSSGTGDITLYQPPPPYLEKGVEGSYVGFGKKGMSRRKSKKLLKNLQDNMKNKKGKKDKKDKKSRRKSKKLKKKLKTKFQGKTITLDSNNEISIN